MENNLLKELRELTGAGMMDIKEALAEAANEKDKAIEILRKKGAMKMGKKSDRIANEGLVEAYIHPGGRVGVLLELNCETDFVARTDAFKELSKGLALHIAAANPLYITSTEVPPEVVEKEKEIYKEQLKDKPADVVEKILEGKIGKFYEEVCLMDQPFVKDPSLKVSQFFAEAGAKMGENIQIRRFVRYALGN